MANKSVEATPLRYVPDLDRWVKKMKTTLIAILMMAFSIRGVFAGAEYVTLIKVLDNDDQGIIERRNGERWITQQNKHERYPKPTVRNPEKLNLKLLQTSEAGRGTKRELAIHG